MSSSFIVLTNPMSYMLNTYIFQIYLDHNNIKDVNVGWLRNQLGVVSQEPVLFDITIAENIRLGKPDASEDEIRTAAVEANAHEFIQKLPQVTYPTVFSYFLNV